MFKKRIIIALVASMVCGVCGCSSDGESQYQQYIDGGRVDADLPNLISETKELISSEITKVKRNEYIITASNTDKVEVYDTADEELYNANNIVITLETMKWKSIGKDGAVKIHIDNETKKGISVKVKYLKLNEYTIGCNSSCKIEKYRDGSMEIKVDSETLGAFKRETENEDITRATVVLEIKDSSKEIIDGYAEFLVAREGMYEIKEVTQVETMPQNDAAIEQQGTDVGVTTTVMPSVTETPVENEQVDTSVETVGSTYWTLSKEVYNKDGVVVSELYTSESDKKNSGWSGRRVEFKVENNSDRNISVSKASVTIEGSKVKNTLHYGCCMNDSILVSCVTVSKKQLKEAKVKSKQLSDIKVILEIKDSDTGEDLGVCETGIFNE